MDIQSLSSQLPRVFNAIHCFSIYTKNSYLASIA